MAGKRLAARWIAVWGLGFAMGLVAAQPMAGIGRGGVPGSTDLGPPTASPDRSASEAVAISKPVGASAPGGRRLTGAMQFDARYDFDVTVESNGRARVIERLAATNRTARPIDHLDLFVLPNLDAPGFREFELGSIRLDGREIGTSWTQDGANMRVDLPNDLESGRTARLVLHFTLTPGGPSGGDLAAALSRSGNMVQFLLWYPMLSDGHGAYLDSDGGAATPAGPIGYVIRTTEPETIAVPGIVSQRTDREVRGSLEHARDLAFAVGRGVRTWSGRAASGADVMVMAPAKAGGGEALKLAIGALNRDEALLRTPYPATGLVVVGGATNMESSGIVFVDLEHLEDPYTVSHEVAHEWFHWLVGNDQLREPWLDEAFATYLGDGLVPRHEDGFCSELPVNQPVWRFESADPRITWQRCGDFMETVYYKGSWLLHTVRKAMGDDAFLASLEDYLDSHRFGIATTADLVAIWRAHSAAVTPRLLEPWLDLRAHTTGARRHDYPSTRWPSSMSSSPARA